MVWIVWLGQGACLVDEHLQIWQVAGAGKLQHGAVPLGSQDLHRKLREATWRLTRLYAGICKDVLIPTRNSRKARICVLLCLLMLAAEAVVQDACWQQILSMWAAFGWLSDESSLAGARSSPWGQIVV